MTIILPLASMEAPLSRAGAGRPAGPPARRLSFPRGGAVRDEDGRGEPVVLGLREHVRGEPHGVRGPVRDDEYLARTGYHVYGHLAEDLALRLRDEGVARPTILSTRGTVPVP